MHNEVDGEKMENIWNPLDDTQNSLIPDEFVAVIVTRNLCINNYQKFLHSKLIEHVRRGVKKAVINLSIEMRWTNRSFIMHRKPWRIKFW